MKKLVDNDSPDPACVKCCFVGDQGVGKSSVLLYYTLGICPEFCESTIFDTYAVDVTLDEELYTLGMFDTASQAKFESLRAFSYTQSCVCVVCFSVTDPVSLDNAEKIWIPEVRRYNRKQPIILVGMQTDKRYDESVSTMDVISRIEGQNVADNCGASAYLECSAYTNENIQQLFNEVLLSAISENKRKRSGKFRVIIRRLSDRIKNKRS